MKSSNEIYEERRKELRRRNRAKCSRCGAPIREIFSEDGKRIVELDAKIYKLYSLAGYAICGEVSGYKIHSCDEKRQQCLKL